MKVTILLHFDIAIAKLKFPLIDHRLLRRPDGQPFSLIRISPLTQAHFQKGAICTLPGLTRREMNLKILTEKSRSSRGQTIIEFALIIALLFVCILGIMEFSMILYDKAILTDACREGARAGIEFRANTATFAYAPLTEAEIKTLIGNYVQNRLVTFGAPFDAQTDVVVTWDPDPPSHGGELEVQVNFTYTFLALPNFGGLGAGTLDLTARSIMRME